MKNNKGFTLIEMLLYVAIVSIVMSTLIAFAWNVIISGARNTTQQEVYSQSRYVTERLKYEIRNANDINIDTSNFDVNLATNPSAQLSLAVNSPNNPTLITVDSGKAMIKLGGSAAVALNSADTTVTDLTFSNYSDSRTQHISFTLTLISNSSSTRKEYQQTISIRSSAELRSN